MLKYEQRTQRATPKDLRFWLQEQPHEAVWANVERISKLTQRRKQDDLYYACLYDDAELAALLDGVRSIGEYTPQTLATNIVRRQVDAYVAKITKNRPTPMGLTTGGNYAQQRRAKALSRFGEGILDETKFWNTRMLRHRDAAVWGSGLALNYRVGREIKHERIWPLDVRVDPREALRGNPRTLYLRRFVDRLILAEMYPDAAEDIADADSHATEDYWEPSWDETSDLVLVVDAWHLPSTETASDGAFCRTISNRTLENREYRRQCFPISKFDFAPPMFGWFGEGMARQLAGLQYEVNAMGLRLQERHYLMGTYVTRDAMSSFEIEQLDNGTLTELVYSGREPNFIAPPAAHPDLFQWYRALRQEFPAEISGQSVMSTRGEMPAGLMGSGKAQRVHQQIQDEAFTPQGRRDEQDVIDTLWQFFDLADEIADEAKAAKAEGKDTSAYVVRVERREHGRSVLDELDYDQVRLDRKSFTLRVFSTSFLASTPEDRYAQVEEMTKAGFLSQDEAMSLLDFPDVQKVLNLRTAARRNIERILDKMLDPDNDPYKVMADYPPEPQMNPELCVALGLSTYLEAKLDGAPPKHLEAVMEWVEMARQIMSGETSTQGPGAPGELPGDVPPPAPAPPPDAMMGGPGFLPPEEPLAPEGAMAPEAMPMLPEM